MKAESDSLITLFWDMNGRLLEKGESYVVIPRKGKGNWGLRRPLCAVPREALVKGSAFKRGCRNPESEDKNFARTLTLGRGGRNEEKSPKWGGGKREKIQDSFSQQKEGRPLGIPAGGKNKA